MVLNVTLIKSIRIMKDTIDSQHSDKHAITKVFLCKDWYLLLWKENLGFTNFMQKEKWSQTKTCNHTYQDSNPQQGI